MNNISLKTCFRVVACSNTAFWAIAAAMIALIVMAVTNDSDMVDETGVPSFPMVGLFQAAYYLSAIFTVVAMALTFRKGGVGAALIGSSALVQIVLGVITTASSVFDDYLQVLEGNIFIAPFIMMLAALLLNIVGTGLLAPKVKGMKIACCGYSLSTISFAAILALFFALINRAMEAMDDEAEEHFMSQDAFTIIMLTLASLMVLGVIVQLIGWWRAKPKEQQ